MSRELSELLILRERQAVRAFLKRVFEEYPGHIDNVVLFGSKARGDAHPESDVDILLLTDTDDWRFKHTISSIAADIGLEFDLLIDARVIGKDRWEHMKQAHFCLYENVVREGIALTPVPA